MTGALWGSPILGIKNCTVTIVAETLFIEVLFYKSKIPPFFQMYKDAPVYSATLSE